MLNQILFGLLLGWGAAIPIGPINLEMIRRNLRFGLPYGVALGLGACSADVTFLILLSFGALIILNHPMVLRVFGFLGSIVLLWFGYCALRLKAYTSQQKDAVTNHPLRHTLEGYAMTMLNPSTILFWSSVSAQIAVMANNEKNMAIYAGLGVFLGTLSWVVAMNGFLFLTRHRLSEKAMHRINITGGVLLIGFGLFGFFHSIFW